MSRHRKFYGHDYDDEDYEDDYDDDYEEEDDSMLSSSMKDHVLVRDTNGHLRSLADIAPKQPTGKFPAKQPAVSSKVSSTTPLNVTISNDVLGQKSKISKIIPTSSSQAPSSPSIKIKQSPGPSNGPSEGGGAKVAAPLSHLATRMGYVSRPSIEKMRKPQIKEDPAFSTNLPMSRVQSNAVLSSGSSSGPVSAPSNDLPALLHSFQKARPTGESARPLISVVTLGHVDAGKSTMMGHLMLQVGMIDARVVAKHKRDAERLGKASFAYAWVLDEGTEERERGITVHCAHTPRFVTRHRTVQVSDAPGHRDLVPNAILGACSADSALLVVNAANGEFETGFSPTGQTREHAMLARSLGISQMVVAVNKMDQVDWSRTRFQEIVSQLGNFLFRVAGYKENDVAFIPVSGYHGINLVNPVSDTKHENRGNGEIVDSTSLAAWWTFDFSRGYAPRWSGEHAALTITSVSTPKVFGPSLIDCLDCLQSTFTTPSAQHDLVFEHPARLTVLSVGGASSDVIQGNLLSGSLQSGDRLLIQPSNFLTTVKSVVLSQQDAIGDSDIDLDDSSPYSNTIAFAGDQVIVTLMASEATAISTGLSVLVSPTSPLSCARRFQARVIIFDSIVSAGGLLTRGSAVTIYIQAAEQPARCTRVLCELQRQAFILKNAEARVLTKGMSGVAEFDITPPSLGLMMCLFSEFKPLGRFLIRMHGTTIGAGMVLRVVQEANSQPPSTIPGMGTTASFANTTSSFTTPYNPNVNAIPDSGEI